MPHSLEQGILTGPEIAKRLHAGAIRCDPFVPDQLAQASIEVHLQPILRLYKDTYDHFRMPIGKYKDFQVLAPVGSSFGGYHRAIPNGWEQPILSLEEESPSEIVNIPPKGIIIFPGVFVLGATVERISSPQFGLVLDGKSSPARKSLKVHFTAGYIEPGFDGNVTFEIETTLPLHVKAYWPVGQIRFHTMVGPIDSYAEKGNYQGALASGPVASQSHKHRQRHVPEEYV